MFPASYTCSALTQLTCMETHDPSEHPCPAHGKIHWITDVPPKTGPWTSAWSAPRGRLRCHLCAGKQSPFPCFVNEYFLAEPRVIISLPSWSLHFPWAVGVEFHCPALVPCNKVLCFLLTGIVVINGQIRLNHISLAVFGVARCLNSASEKNPILEKCKLSIHWAFFVTVLEGGLLSVKSHKDEFIFKMLLGEEEGNVRFLTSSYHKYESLSLFG